MGAAGTGTNGGGLGVREAEVEVQHVGRGDGGLIGNELRGRGGGVLAPSASHFP